MGLGLFVRINAIARCPNVSEKYWGRHMVADVSQILIRPG